MYIKVTVLTDQKKYSIKETKENRFQICVKEKPKNNMANKKVMDILAEYFAINKNKIKIINGHHSPKKMVNIDS